jgi:hypothetical protein
MQVRVLHKQPTFGETIFTAMSWRQALERRMMIDLVRDGGVCHCGTNVHNAMEQVGEIV